MDRRGTKIRHIGHVTIVPEGGPRELPVLVLGVCLFRAGPCSCSVRQGLRSPLSKGSASCNVAVATPPRPWRRRLHHLLLLNLGGPWPSTRTTESSSPSCNPSNRTSP